MIFTDLCLKIYFWPFLSYLANIKGLCPYYPYGYFPIITLPPGTILTPNTIIPTFQPTPPIVTTLAPCPAMPLVCLAGGVRPIPYCPCIDPRQNMQTTTAAPNSALRLAPTETVGSNMMVFAPLDDAKRKKRRRKRDIRKKLN